MEILTFRVDRLGGDKTLCIEASMDKMERISTKDVNRAIEQIIDQHFKGNAGLIPDPHVDEEEEMENVLPVPARPIPSFSRDCSTIID